MHLAISVGKHGSCMLCIFYFPQISGLTEVRYLMRNLEMTRVFVTQAGSCLLVYHTGVCQY